jgi:cytochrome d ubiquinol oxidase subunit I
VSLLDLSRWQFAITVLFHMTFPAITVGLSILLCVLSGMHWKTGNPVHLQLFRFWRRIFAVGFAIGIVAGIVMTFEMGLNWGVYAARTGPIIGPIVGMEVVTAFFVEAGFIGILLYGDGRVRQGTMFAATVMVSIGTLLSSTWIIAANSWMQTPAGFAVHDGQFRRSYADRDRRLRRRENHPPERDRIGPASATRVRRGDRRTRRRLLVHRDSRHQYPPRQLDGHR